MQASFHDALVFQIGVERKFLEDIAAEYGQPKKVIEKKASEALEKHNWSGNIRELRNVVERLIILSGKSISADDVENYVLPKK